MKQRVLILCTGNSARSQMAEGLLLHDAGDRFDVVSAGTNPAPVRREAVAVMDELGIDISSHESKNAAQFSGETFDYVLTVCDHARETCPMFPGARHQLHHNFEDPAAATGTEEARLDAFRRVRDEIRQYLGTFPGRAG